MRLTPSESTEDCLLMAGQETALRAVRGLSAHILPTSATMIGVCMTVLSIAHLGTGDGLRMANDKLVAVDSLVFLASAVMSFMSMRSAGPQVRLESWAESVFVVGLALLACAAVLVAFVVR
jgi:hypothetical protein